MNLLKRLLMSIGLIISGFIISNIDIHESLTSIQIYQSEIFHTNCRIIFQKTSVDIDSPLAEMPPLCSTLTWLIPASLIANGVTVLFTGLSGVGWLITSLNLLGYAALFVNPIIDSSFPNYAHAIQILICIFGLLLCFSKPHPKSQS